MMKKILFMFAAMLMIASCGTKGNDRMVDNIIKAQSSAELTCAERKLAGRIADVLPQAVAFEDGKFVLVMESQEFESRRLPHKVYEMISGEVESLNTLLGNGALDMSKVGEDLMYRSAEEFRKLSVKE